MKHISLFSVENSFCSFFVQIMIHFTRFFDYVKPHLFKMEIFFPQICHFNMYWKSHHSSGCDLFLHGGVSFKIFLLLQHWFFFVCFLKFKWQNNLFFLIENLKSKRLLQKYISYIIKILTAYDIASWIINSLSLKIDLSTEKLIALLQTIMKRSVFCLATEVWNHSPCPGAGKQTPCSV